MRPPTPRFFATAAPKEDSDETGVQRTKKVLAAVDLTPVGRRVADRARLVAEEHDSPLTLVHAFDPAEGVLLDPGEIGSVQADRHRPCPRAGRLGPSTNQRLRRSRDSVGQPNRPHRPPRQGSGPDCGRNVIARYWQGWTGHEAVGAQSPDGASWRFGANRVGRTSGFSPGWISRMRHGRRWTWRPNSPREQRCSQRTRSYPVLIRCSLSRDGHRLKLRRCMSDGWRRPSKHWKHSFCRIPA
jgi:hypothetical protein